MHLYLDHAVTFAGFAAPTLHVKRETTGPITTLLGGRGLGEDFPNGGKHPGVSGRVGARRATNRALVDIDDFVEMLQTFNRVMLSRLGMRPVNFAGRRGIERLVHQGGFARARNTGDTNQ